MELVTVPLLPIPTDELAVESGMVVVVGPVERGIEEVVNVLLEVGQMTVVVVKVVVTVVVPEV